MNPATRVAAANELVPVAIGVAVILRGPQWLHVGANFGLGGLAAMIGLSEAAAFVHPVVLSTLPSHTARLVIATAVSIGAARARRWAPIR